MPKLWETTVTAHRASVSDAIVETTWRLAHARGLRGVTMSAIATEVGISRATLYKYFPDVDSIVVAAHHRHVRAHLEQLQGAHDRHDDPQEALVEVLATYAEIQQHRAGHEVVDLAAVVHASSAHQEDAQRAVHVLLARVIAATRFGPTCAAQDAAPTAQDRALASLCLHALGAAAMPGANVDEAVAFCLRGIETTGS